MSVPEKHHYLPVWYLDRWAKEGKVMRFVRPRGAEHPLHMTLKPPSAICYERDLYAIPTEADPRERQRLEVDFYQRIDDRAAVAFTKIDREEEGTGDDRVAFAQFVLSLALRNPEVIRHSREELRGRIGPEASECDIEDLLTAHVNTLLADIIQSPTSIERVGRMKVFKIVLNRARRSLLTSDRPTMLSMNVPGRDGFIVFPYGPDRLIVLANDQEVAQAFYSQDHNSLANAVNEAVVLQAKSVIIACDDKERAFIEERFLRLDAVAADALDDNGMVRWKSPLTRLGPTGKRRFLIGTAKGGFSYLIS